MKIYNTLTRQKEDFIPITPGEAKIYACGPTVYNFIHIGNARPLCVFDVLRRYLEWRGLEVKFVMREACQMASTLICISSSRSSGMA